MQGLQNTKLAVCILARDCAKQLSANIVRLEYLARYCKELHYFVVENDSKDNTRAILDNWKQKSKHRVHLPNIYKYYELVRNMQTSHGSKVTIDFDRSKDSMQERDVFIQRIKRIAFARDCYLHALQQSDFIPDIVMMLDIDLFSFSVKNIVQSIQESDRWDVITANGRKYELITHGAKSSIKNIYYDSYAVELHGISNTPFYWNKEFQLKFATLSKHDSVVPVNSAFGGLALYQYKALYNSGAMDKDNIGLYSRSIHADNYQFCEHVSLHRVLRERGHDKIFIHPRLEVWYNSYIRALGRKVIFSITRLLS